MLTGARFVVDTNVLIDYLVERKPFNAKAELLMALGYINEFELWIGTSQVSDIVYVITDGGKPSLSEYAQDTMTALKKMLHIYTTDAEDYDNVARCSFDDLEDAFVFQAALKVKADAIITNSSIGSPRKRASNTRRSQVPSTFALSKPPSSYSPGTSPVSMIFTSASSSRTGTPSSSALRSLLPAPGPATT